MILYLFFAAGGFAIGYAVCLRRTVIVLYRHLPNPDDGVMASVAMLDLVEDTLQTTLPAPIWRYVQNTTEKKLRGER